MSTITKGPPLAAHASQAPAELPFCPYPAPDAFDQHGLQPLPREAPCADFGAVRRYRAPHLRVAPLAQLAPEQTLEAARVVAASFVQREPQTRHIQPPRRPTDGVLGTVVRDPFGSAAFGDWSKRELFYWFIRAMVLTDPASPGSAICARQDVLEQSLAALDPAGRIIGGAFNETLPRLDEPLALREDDPVVAAAWNFLGPILERLIEQDIEALDELCRQYPDFKAACDAQRVGHHFMVARGDYMPRRDAFELVARSAQRYQELGFAYMVVEATNQWTGAACEALGAVRAHYRPYRDRPALPASPDGADDATTSPDGYIAAKPSGCMFYALRLT